MSSTMNLGGFEREEDIIERRKQRQEEWEKVRTAEQPELVPEEPYDGRSLYDRLKEQKDAKDLEFEESRKFKNMIRGLDDDEVDHLAEMDNKKISEERRQKEEELKEINDYRAKVAELQELNSENKLNQIGTSKAKPKESTSLSRSSQRSLLSSVVKRKSITSTQTEPQEKRRTLKQPSALKCLAVLPGIGDYKSSDSDASSEELDEVLNGKTDITGRHIKKKKEHDE